MGYCPEWVKDAFFISPSKLTIPTIFDNFLIKLHPSMKLHMQFSNKIPQFFFSREAPIFFILYCNFLLFFIAIYIPGMPTIWYIRCDCWSERYWRRISDYICYMHFYEFVDFFFIPSKIKLSGEKGFFLYQGFLKIFESSWEIGMYLKFHKKKRQITPKLLRFVFKLICLKTNLNSFGVICIFFVKF